MLAQVLMCLLPEILIYILTNRMTLKLGRTISLLNEFGLSQRVDKPTHKLGHILDWVVVRDTNSCTLYDDVLKYPGLSDHFAVFGRFAVSKPPLRKHLVTSRNLRAIGIESLQSDMLMS